VSEKNLVIPLTGAGAAAVAVVRIAGPLVEPFLTRYFRGSPRAGRCVHGELSDGERIIDDVLVALSDGGRTADINLHGSPWIVARLIGLAEAFGFIVTDGGAACLEAVDGETLLEREVAAYLPLARTELALRALTAQPTAWERWDGQGVSELIADRSLWQLLHPPGVAIVGAPNVGKSTLANRLFGRKRSITADKAGTTRDWVQDFANADGLPILLTDTPGLRSSVDVIESAAIAASRGEVEAAELVILLLDVSQPLEGEQTTVLREFPNAMRVANKMDLPPAWASGYLKICAESGAGVDNLRRKIAAHFGCADMIVGRPRWWTHRQLDLLRQAESDPRALEALRRC
jgi:small GTP-binding protein